MSEQTLTEKASPFYSAVNAIIDFENGDLDDNETIALFSALRKSGLLFQLQGFYGRTFMSLVRGGYLNEAGDVLALPDEVD
jgi:hypothetical protein